MSERGSPAQPHRHRPRQRERTLLNHESLQFLQYRSHLFSLLLYTQSVIDGKRVTWHMTDGTIPTVAIALPCRVLTPFFPFPSALSDAGSPAPAPLPLWLTCAALCIFPKCPVYKNLFCYRTGTCCYPLTLALREVP